MACVGSKIHLKPNVNFKFKALSPSVKVVRYNKKPNVTFSF